MMKSPKRAVFWVGVVAFPVLVIELSSLVALHSVRRAGWEIRATREVFSEQTTLIEGMLEAGERSRIKIDPVMGWTYRPGFKSLDHSINDQGLRALRTYAEARPDSLLRVAAFGDSFVYCEEVSTEACWSHVAESGWPTLEVLNYGVGGYGTDQAFLRFLAEGQQLSPDIVLIGFAPVNLRRAPNVYRRFISERELPLVKPRFELQGDSLVKLDIPIPDSADYRALAEDPTLVLAYGEHDRWFSAWVYRNPLHDLSASTRLITALTIRVWRRYLDPDRLLLRDASFNPRSSILELQVALLESFADSVSAANGLPVLVFFPDRTSVERVRAGHPTTYAILRASMEEKDFTILDLADAFESAESDPAGIGAWFAPGSHYSPLGNTLVGEWLGRNLGKLGLQTGESRTSG